MKRGKKEKKEKWGEEKERDGERGTEGERKRRAEEKQEENVARFFVEKPSCDKSTTRPELTENDKTFMCQFIF